MNTTAYKLPISVKGVVLIEDKVLLLKNERDEWELPGGRLEPGETPSACVVREICEETSLRTSVDRLLNVWVYGVAPCQDVFIVTFGCKTIGSIIETRLSTEHSELRLFPIGECDKLRMPDGYKLSIKLWYNCHLDTVDTGGNR